MRFLSQTPSIYDLALDAIRENKPLTDLINSRLSDEAIDDQSVYDGRDTWQVLPASITLAGRSAAWFRAQA